MNHRTIAGCLLIAFAPVGHAANLGFLMNSPVSYMKEKDFARLNSAASTALNTKDDGQSLAWDNSGTGNSVEIHGTVTPSETSKDSDPTCRKIEIVAKAKGQTQTWAPVACRVGGEKWALQPH